MEQLSKCISQINNLKNKIEKYAKGIWNDENNILQKKEVKGLNSSDKAKIENLYSRIQYSPFNITNISKKYITLETYYSEIDPWDKYIVHIKKEEYIIKNIFFYDDNEVEG